MLLWLKKGVIPYPIWFSNGYHGAFHMKEPWSLCHEVYVPDFNIGSCNGLVQAIYFHSSFIECIPGTKENNLCLFVVLHTMIWNHTPLTWLIVCTKIWKDLLSVNNWYGCWYADRDDLSPVTLCGRSKDLPSVQTTLVFLWCCAGLCHCVCAWCLMTHIDTIMMMVGQENAFHFIGPLWWESLVDSPHKEPAMWSFDVLCWQLEHTVEQQICCWF